MSQRASGYRRQPDDVYETPAWVTQTVVPYLRRRSLHIWDPANGPSGKLARILCREGFRVVATVDDFLLKTSLPDPSIDAIVTNPPYGCGGRLACQFIGHALTLAPLVAMLLRVDFDSGKTRTSLFRDSKIFAHKIVLLDRIVWAPRKGAAGPSENHAWLIWNQRHHGAPTIGYASNPNNGRAGHDEKRALAELELCAVPEFGARHGGAA
jgi:hypothetical protein